MEINNMHSDREDFTQEAWGIQFPHRFPPTVLLLPPLQWELLFNTSYTFTFMEPIRYFQTLELLLRPCWVSLLKL